MNINGYKLIMTCAACPEQYDVTIDGDLVGYLRLRNGHFTVSYPYCGGKIIYESYPKGDGMFNDHERSYYLTKAISAIHNERKSYVQ